VDGAAPHPIHTIAELPLQTLGDFAGRLVGEGEDTDSRWIDAEPLDEKANALDEAKSLAGSRAGEDEQWSRGCFDGVSL
jgi:hypothetical protein